MSRNGSGVYNLPTGNPVTTSTTISSSWANSTLNDIAAALTQSLSKDGQTQMTNNLPMAGYKLSGLGAGTGNGESLRFEQLFSQGNPIDIAGATTTDIGSVSSNFLNVTGSATITSLGTNYNGPKFLKFTGASTLTYNATTLVTPTSENIVTPANSMFIAVPKSTTSGISNGWYVIPLAGYALLTGATFTGDVTVPDEAYGAGWDGSLEVPTKNAVYDKIQSLNLSGKLAITANSTLVNADFGKLVVNETASNWIVTLPSVTDNANKSISFSALGTGSLTINRAGSATISANGATGLTSVVLTNGQSLTLFCDGTNWLLANDSNGVISSRTAIPTTSGTSHDFLDIPAGVKRVTVMFSGVSTNGTARRQIQIGDSGGFETTGYNSNAAVIGIAANSTVASGNTTTGFILDGIAPSASSVVSGIITLTNISGDIWVASGSFADSSGGVAVTSFAGTKSLSATLDRLRLTTVNGTDTFDAGLVNILIE